MTRRMYWGIATLILLLGITGVFLFMKERAEFQQLKKELAESNKLVEEYNKEKTKQPTAEVTKQPPPGASPNGHWHGDEWHDAPHQTPIVVAKEPVEVDVSSQDSETSMDNLSDEEFRRLYREGLTEEEFASYREIETKAFPQNIKYYKEMIASAEKIIEQAKKNPPISELGKQLLERAHKRLARNKVRLANTQRILEVVYGVK